MSFLFSSKSNSDGVDTERTTSNDASLAHIVLRPNGHFVPKESDPLWPLPSPKHISAVVDGRKIADSHNVVISHEHGYTPIYYFPREDVDMGRLVQLSDGSTHCSRKGDAQYFAYTKGDGSKVKIGWSYENPIAAAAPLAGRIAFYFNHIDAWYEDGTQIFGSVPDPFVRIDIRDLAGSFMVMHEGEIIAQSTRAKILYETGLTPRIYIPQEDILAALSDSETNSVCVYKGTASYKNVIVKGETIVDGAWSYPDPLPACHAIAGHWSLWFEKFDQTTLDRRLLTLPPKAPDAKPIISRADIARD